MPRRTKIAGLLWPDVPEANALRNLRQALNNLKTLRRAVKEGTLPARFDDPAWIAALGGRGEG